MAMSTRPARANKAPKPIPRYESTHRVAYDADAEEDQIPNKSTQPVPSPQNQRSVDPLIRSIQDVARDCSRLKQNEPRNHRRPPGTSVSQNSSKSRKRKVQTEALGVSTVSPKVITATNATNSKTNQASTDPNSDWDISEPHDKNQTRFEGHSGKWGMAWDGVYCFEVDDPTHPVGSIGYDLRIVRKRQTKFTDLPPEIRNKIYEYAVPERKVLIVRRHPKKEAREFEGFWSEEGVTRKPRQSRLMYEPEWEHTYEGFGSIINLMLTGKQIKSEIETFFYSRIQFCFQSLKSLRTFLRGAPKGGIRAIRSVYIQQDGYGNSKVMEYQRYRDTYYQRWKETCTRLGQMAENLQHLKLKVYDREWPCVLSGKDYNPSWGESILTSAPTLLPKVEVRVHHRMIDRNRAVLKDLARRIEDNMMTLAGREERDRIETEWAFAQIAARNAAREERTRRRLAKLNAPPPPTELTISIDDIQKQAIKTSVVKKVRSKGLERFTKVDLSIYNLAWKCD